MLNVIIALCPAALYGVYIYGIKALIVIVVSVVTAVVSEAVFQKIRKQPVTVSDLSAALTGLLLAMNVPPSAPWWLVVVGSAFAIIIAKQVFGGIGHNFINPALAARAVLISSWSARMGTWDNAKSAASIMGYDAVTGPTPLGVIAETQGGLPAIGTELPTFWDAFVGNVGGCIGETSALLLIVGGVYLIYKGIITWHIPVAYIASSFVFAFFLYGFSVEYSAYSLVIGGLMLGAFYMSTDYASSPVTNKGKIIYGIGAGLLTILIRRFGSLPEGVSYSILLMNVATPMIDRFSINTIFGGVSRKDKKAAKKAKKEEEKAAKLAEKEAAKKEEAEGEKPAENEKVKDEGAKEEAPKTEEKSAEEPMTEEERKAKKRAEIKAKKEAEKAAKDGAEEAPKAEEKPAEEPMTEEERKAKKRAEIKAKKEAEKAAKAAEAPKSEGGAE